MIICKRNVNSNSENNSSKKDSLQKSEVTRSSVAIEIIITLLSLIFFPQITIYMYEIYIHLLDHQKTYIYMLLRIKDANILKKYFLITALIFISGTFLVAATKVPQKVYAQSSGFVCPSKNIQHWDKIVFFIRSADLARRVNLPVNSELDIKVLDDPAKVADIKQKVLSFLKVPNEPRSSIQILYVRYAMICG